MMMPVPQPAPRLAAPPPRSRRIVKLDPAEETSPNAVSAELLALATRKDAPAASAPVRPAPPRPAPRASELPRKPSLPPPLPPRARAVAPAAVESVPASPSAPEVKSELSPAEQAKPAMAEQVDLAKAERAELAALRSPAITLVRAASYFVAFTSLAALASVRTWVRADLPRIVAASRARLGVEWARASQRAGR